MLSDFLTQHRDTLVGRCRAKVAARVAPRPTEHELQVAIPIFLDHLIAALERERGNERAPSPPPDGFGGSAVRHGGELLQRGFTIDQVVHDYGDLCQSVTELAGETNASITPDEYRTFNRCLDDAIADAVTEFGRQSNEVLAREGAEALNVRLGTLAHELRNLLNSATLAFTAIKSGGVAVSGATGAVLDRSLVGLRNVIDRSLAEVRLTAGLDARREAIPMREFLEEVAIAATLDANARGVAFTVSPHVDGAVVEGDRQLLTSAVSNLLQNAFKFTKPRGSVSLAATADGDRVVLDVTDQCGGLPAGKLEELIQPFAQGARDRTGLGLGLAIVLGCVEANRGTLRARSLPGTGCVFTIDLPRRSG